MVTENSELEEAYVLLPMYRNGKGGYIDRSGNLVVAPQFDRVSRFSEDLAIIGITEKNIYYELEVITKIEEITKHGYIDETGKVVIEPQFQNAGPFCEGLAYVLDGNYEPHGLYGYINHSGEMVIEPQFYEAYSFSENLAPVCLEESEDCADRWGYINKTGEIVIKPHFYDAGCFCNGLAPVCFKENSRKYLDSWGYIDREGKIVLEPQFHYAKSFSGGLAAVCVEPVEYDDEWIDVWSYIDTTGQVVLGPRLGRCSYKLRKKGYTEQVVDSYIRDADAFSEGLAAVELRVGNKWGYDGGDIRRKWGYIDKKGNLVIEPIFSLAGRFLYGLALVTPSDSEGITYIDKSGNINWNDKNQGDKKQ
ncbi:hypothetical protein GF312_13740 [Candidatus Poribacteria bacterium]|nr:hypothetical protein [Candidatus Poribacteria bacterium]